MCGGNSRRGRRKGEKRREEERRKENGGREEGTKRLTGGTALADKLTPPVLFATFRINYLCDSLTGTVFHLDKIHSLSFPTPFVSHPFRRLPFLACSRAFILLVLLLCPRVSFFPRFLPFLLSLFAYSNSRFGNQTEPGRNSLMALARVLTRLFRDALRDRCRSQLCVN